MYEVRNIWEDLFGYLAGTNTKRVWSFGYYTAEGAERCDDTWVEIDSMPHLTPYDEIASYIGYLNSSSTEEPTAAAITSEEPTCCPSCGTLARYAEPEDHTSDFGCPSCLSFVSVDGTWVKSTVLEGNEAQAILPYTSVPTFVFRGSVLCADCLKKDLDDMEREGLCEAYPADYWLLTDKEVMSLNHQTCEGCEKHLIMKDEEPTAQVPTSNKITFEYRQGGFLVRRVDGTAQTLLPADSDGLLLLAETFGWDGPQGCDTDIQALRAAYAWLWNLYHTIDELSDLTADDPTFFDHC